MKITYQYITRVFNLFLFILVGFYLFVTDYDKRTGHWYLLLLILTSSWMFDVFLSERIKKIKKSE